MENLSTLRHKLCENCSENFPSVFSTFLIIRLHVRAGCFTATILFRAGFDLFLTFPNAILAVCTLIVPATFYSCVRINCSLLLISLITDKRMRSRDYKAQMKIRWRARRNKSGGSITDCTRIRPRAEAME